MCVCVCVYNDEKLSLLVYTIRKHSFMLAYFPLLAVRLETFLDLYVLQSTSDLRSSLKWFSTGQLSIYICIYIYATRFHKRGLKSIV